MADLELTFIGSGNAFVREGACWNGFVANGRYLFEAPPQALMALNRLGIDPNAIDAVVLSHHHGDHLLGLPFLLLHWKYLGRTTPVTIVGPPETEDVVREISRRTYPTLFEGGAEIRWETATPGTPVEAAGLRWKRWTCATTPSSPPTWASTPPSRGGDWGTPATAPCVTASWTSRAAPRCW